MPVAKLAGFLDMTEQEFRIQLLVFKHKMKNLVWTSGISALDGEFQSASEVDFYIDKVSKWMLVCFLLCTPPSIFAHLIWLVCKITRPDEDIKLTFNELSSLLQDMIHIADTKVARRYGDFFIRQIHKFEEVSRKMFFLIMLIRILTWGLSYSWIEHWRRCHCLLPPHLELQQGDDSQNAVFDNTLTQ